MDAAALTPRALFDGNICYEVPPFQRPYVWTEEEQWQPLWDDVERFANALIDAREGGDRGESFSHFLGAVVLKQADSPAGDVARRSVIDGQQRLTTLQLLMDATQLVLDEYGDEGDAESIQELVFNSAKRFHGTPSRFKLWPSRIDRYAFEYVMDNDLTVTSQAASSRIHQAHVFFATAVRAWAEVGGDPEKTVRRLSVLAEVLQQRLRIVAINLSASDDDQLIFETLNGRGTPLLAADHIKNYLFQQCEQIGADVDTWTEVYWQDFDDDWWRGQVAQGRLYRSRIDLFLQYWLTMKVHDEIPTEELFTRFRSFAAPELRSSAPAAAFLASLRHDADTYRDLVTKEGDSPVASFYNRVVEEFESGSFIPLLLWITSDAHAIPEAQARKALDAVESMVIRRILLRMTTKDFNGLVVSALKALDGTTDDEAGTTIADFLARQVADSRTWPTDETLREQLPGIRLYGNVKQSRIRMILSALELRYRTVRHEDVTLPKKLEIEHVMPRGWRTHWADSIQDDPERAARRDLLVDTLGNLTLVTKKLNGTLSNRPWRDADAATITSARAITGSGKRSLLNQYSLLVLNKDIVGSHKESWSEEDIGERSRQLTEAVISVWPRPIEPVAAS